MVRAKRRACIWVWIKFLTMCFTVVYSKNIHGCANYLNIKVTLRHLHLMLNVSAITTNTRFYNRIQFQTFLDGGFCSCTHAVKSPGFTGGPKWKKWAGVQRGQNIMLMTDEIGKWHCWRNCWLQFLENYKKKKKLVLATYDECRVAMLQ